jgi:tetratricopeptide (TPR) repeat protein
LLANDDPLVRIRAELVGLVATTWTDPTFRHDEGRARLEVLRERALAVGSQELADRCDLMIGLIVFFGGQTEAFREIALRLLPRVDGMPLGERRSIGFGIAASLSWGPLPVAEATDIPDQVERIHGDSMLGRIRAQLLRAALRSMADDGPGFDEAVARYDALHVELGDEAARFINAQPRAEALWRLGRVDEAMRWGLGAKEAYDRLGETGANSTTTALTAYYAIELGESERATSLLDDARAMASPDDFAAHVPIGWGTALLASARGDHASAIEEIERALGMIRPTDYLTYHAETERVHWKVLGAAGRPEEAGVAFDEALAMFERKGDVASAHRLVEERSREP